jgi:uncharacterized RDD family membrane protein YckC
VKTAPKAGWWQRVGATLIDGLILSGAALLVGVALSAGGASSGDATVAIYAVVFFASVVYSPLLMAREGDTNGQTIGKRVIGIRVVHEDGHPMTIKRGLVRDGFGKALLGLIPLYTFVDVFWPIPDGDNQAIHDKVGSTYVVDAHQVPVMTYRADEHDGFGAPVPPPPSAPTPPAPPAPPATPPAAPPRAEPEAEPDLGGFAPPVPPPPPVPSRSEDDEARGPFGPSYD